MDSLPLPRSRAAGRRLRSARGAITAGITWDRGRATEIRLRCDQNRTVRLRIPLFAATFRGDGGTRDGDDTPRMRMRTGQAYRFHALR